MTNEEYESSLRKYETVEVRAEDGIRLGKCPRGATWECGACNCMTMGIERDNGSFILCIPVEFFNFLIVDGDRAFIEGYEMGTPQEAISTIFDWGYLKYQGKLQ